MENLSLFLQKHIGETFWCEMVGNVILQKINEDGTMELSSSVLNDTIKILQNGKYAESGNVILWPDEFTPAWDKWISNNTSLSYEDLPKTLTCNICKHAVLYDKIYKLIDIAYGGHVTKLSFTNRYIEVYFILPESNGSLNIVKSTEIQNITPLAFKSECYARSFMKNPDNVILAKEYYSND